jgi:hypothetical protein
VAEIIITDKDNDYKEYCIDISYNIESIFEGVDSWKNKNNIDDYKVYLNDGFGILGGWTEYDLKTSIELGKSIEQHGEGFAMFVANNNKIPSNIEFMSAFYGEYKSYGEFAQKYCSELGYTEDLPYYIKAAIDWEIVASGLMNSFTMCTDGEKYFVFKG